MLIIKQHFVVQPKVFVWLWCRVSCGNATTIPRQKNVLNTLNQSRREAGKKQILHKLARVQDTEALRWKTDSLAGQHYFCFFHTFFFASVSCFDCLLLLYLYTHFFLLQFVHCAPARLWRYRSDTGPFTGRYLTLSCSSHTRINAGISPSITYDSSVFIHPLATFSAFFIFSFYLYYISGFSLFLVFFHFLSRVLDDRFSRMFVSIRSFFVHHNFLIQYGMTSALFYCFFFNSCFYPYSHLI